MRGFAQVKAVYVQKGKYADVEIAVFGETANLSRDIGDGMLTDLDLSSYDHTLNATNIEASWAGNLSGGVIRYGLPDKGQNWTSSNIWTSTNPHQHRKWHLCGGWPFELASYWLPVLRCSAWLAGFIGC